MKVTFKDSIDAERKECDSRVRHLLVVVRAVKGEASETSLEVIAGLSE